VTNDEPLVDLEALLHPGEQARFRRLCLPTPAEELTLLADEVRGHLDQIRALSGPSTDVEAAAAIARSLVELLADVASMEDEHRALVRGAVEYFILADDASGDLEDVLGFDDDARVLNSVLDRLDRSDLRVELT
jgi:uncharacterized membrane protein YkvA (DUF1232 family)